MDNETAKKLIVYIAEHMEKDHPLLYPKPSFFMSDPYGLLNLIQEETGLNPATIDAWMQPKRSRFIRNVGAP